MVAIQFLSGGSLKSTNDFQDSIWDFQNGIDEKNPAVVWSLSIKSKWLYPATKQMLQKESMTL